MMKRSTLYLAGLGLMLALACNKGQDSPPPAPPESTTTPPPPEATPAGDRPTLTQAECESRGGTVVGDIGDGAVHKPDYRCADGQPPLGSIRAEGDAPVAVEGSVCCPGGAAAG